jgi:hypothetical protein
VAVGVVVDVGSAVGLGGGVSVLKVGVTGGRAAHAHKPRLSATMKE